MLYNALAAARHARLAVTIPGTKTIELAVLGKPAVAITPLNAPEIVTINGPLTYLDRVPLVGAPLKRAAAVALSRRFAYHTQPNMDARCAAHSRGARHRHSRAHRARRARVLRRSRVARGARRTVSHGSIAITSERRTEWQTRCSHWRRAGDIRSSSPRRDREHYLRDTLASLESQAGAPPFEVIVVDNGSRDGRHAVGRGARRRRSAGAVRRASRSRTAAKARNRGVAAARGDYLLFCDDDVRLPAGWVAAHAAAQRGGDYVVNGPILNVGSPDARPAPRAVNYSRAFLCSCNVSLSKRVFLDVGGFDENFDLYGWEDTELGLRLRRLGVGWRFSWEAYLWHIKPPEENTLAVESRKAVEKARMARLFRREASLAARALCDRRLRAQRAAGAISASRLAARVLRGPCDEPARAELAERARAPAALDGIYTRELARTLDAAER